MTSNRREVLAAANRLTERDRRILLLLGQHQVLTTHQVTRAFFDNPRVARRRIQVLGEVGLIACFRPPLLVGTSPKHVVLTPLGLQAISGARSEFDDHLTPRAGALERIVLRPDLGHLVGVNDIFCALLGVSRIEQNTALELWWSERACAKAWGTYVRPDGFGRWREGKRAVDFFLEYDTGAEHSPQVLAKLPGYESVAAVTSIATPVLFWLHSPRREGVVQERLLRAGASFPIATASGDSTDADPSAAVWRLVGAGRGERVRLVDLVSSPRLRSGEHL